MENNNPFENLHRKWGILLANPNTSFVLTNKWNGNESIQQIQRGMDMDDMKINKSGAT
jgi:hypothetical protein